MVFACRKFLCLALAWLMLVTPVWGQVPQAASRFDISGYSVIGAPQLSAEEFSRIVAPFIGQQKNVADVQRALQALQQAYLDFGHCTTQVTAPQLEPQAGVITFRLVPSVTPLTRDCVPVAVLDQKRMAPLVPLAPGEVATRPLADVTGAMQDAAVPEPKAAIARAPTTKPLQDGPVTKPLQDRPPVAPVIAAAPVQPQVAEPSRPVVKPLADVPTVSAQAKPSVSVPLPAAIAQVETAPVATAKVEPAPAPKPAVVAIAPKPELVPEPKVEVAAPAPVAKVEPAPKPAVVAVAPKLEPVC